VATAAPRYARAFAQVVEAGGLDARAVQQQMSDFAQTLAGSAQLHQVLLDPSLELSQKLKVLDAIAARIGIAPKVRNFLAVILEHGRLGDFDEILAAYAELADERADATEALVTSARSLDPDDRARLEPQIARLAGGHVRATYAEDPTLLGGAVVRIGSTVYDGSLRAQLQQLKQRLVNA